MSRLPRTGVVVLVLAVLAVLTLPPAVRPFFDDPPPPEPPAPTQPDPVTLPVNRDYGNKIKAAHDYIAAKEWTKAAGLLQRILDKDEDALIDREEKDPQGKVIGVKRVSARAEAERLLSTLPKAGLEAYRTKCEGLAAVALAKAKADPRFLDDVVRQYLYTNSGTEALALLGIHEFDHGRAGEAADRFRRLLQMPDADLLPPMVFFQAALAFHASGASADEDKAVQKLSKRIGRDGLRVGEQTLALDEVRKQIARWPTTTPSSGDWPLFRGDAHRSGRADGDFPLLEARFRSRPPDDPAAREALEKALATARTALAPPPGQPVQPENYPPLSAFVPIAVGGKLIYRGPDGLHGLDAETGREIWHASSPLCLVSVLNDFQKKYHIRKWLELYKQPMPMPNLLDENALLGSLSSDGRRVYAVEDVPAPPQPQLLTPAQPNPAQPNPKLFFGPAEENIYHSRLRAVDVLTGAFVWEVGGWNKASRAAFADAFFLGAPLPLGGKLYVLVEKRQDVNLLCLDPDTGDLLWAQTLCTTNESIYMDPARRMQAVHLAYSDGVLVCPTNCGAVVAVDPLSRNILWAHVYHERNRNPDEVPPQFNAQQFQDALKGCAPIVHDGKVVVTAPDGDTIRCLDLHDGSLLWKTPRADDLYVAGVFDDGLVLVGRNFCRALALKTGEQTWNQPLNGTPSGLGAAAGKLYFLPLREGGVYALNTVKPDQSSVIEGRNEPALGNLVFHGGDLWSQNGAAVTAYPQLVKGLERVELLVKKDPKNPAALVERGRLLYSKGEIARAVEDWLAALDNKPSVEVMESARERLFIGLTLLLQRDFTAGEKYLVEYQRLCRKPPPADATPELLAAFQAEQRRRQLNLFAILARGRESQGRIDQALTAYRDLFEYATAGELLSLPEDANVRIRPDLWVQERIAALAAQAKGDQRNVIKEQIEADWRAAQSAGGDAALTRFIALYGGVAGPLGAPAREARLVLAERLAEDRDPRRALEAERHLHYLSRQTDSPELVGRALYAWARLLTRHGQMHDAIALYRTLARDFGDKPVHDGKTGAALLEELAADKRFVAYLDDPLASRPAGRVTPVEIAGGAVAKTGLLAVEPQGEVPESCRNLTFTFDVPTLTLQAASKDGSSETWTTPLPQLASIRQPYLQDGSGFSLTYQASGHFLVLSAGPVIVGVDLIERRPRWIRSLLPADTSTITGVNPNGIDGSIQASWTDNSAQRLGVTGPIGPGGVLVQTRSGLTALEPATGELRWLRADAPPFLEAFGDDQHLYFAEMRNGAVQPLRGLRTADGVAVTVPDCLDCFQHKLRTVGRCLLASYADETNGELRVRLYDVQSGKDVWKKTFPAGAKVLDSFVPDLAGVVEPSGAVTVLDLVAQKEALRLSLDRKHVDKLVRGALLRDRTQLYVALQGPLDPATNAIGDPNPNFSGVARWTEVNGMIYAFDRASGEFHWWSRAVNQMLLVDHLDESPVLLCTAMWARQIPGVPGGNSVQVTTTHSIDKRTGKVRYNKEIVGANNDLFHTVQIDPRSGTVELINNTTRLRHFIEAGREPAKPKEG